MLDKIHYIKNSLYQGLIAVLSLRWDMSIGRTGRDTSGTCPRSLAEYWNIKKAVMFNSVFL